MRILLIESGRMDVQWLRSSMQRYATDVEILATHNLADAVQMLHDDVHRLDVIVLDPGVPDALAPGTLPQLIDTAPLIPIVVLMSGKSSYYECVRSPGTRVFYLKTDVSTNAFLHHLRTLMTDISHEHPSHG